MLPRTPSDNSSPAPAARQAKRSRRNLTLGVATTLALVAGGFGLAMLPDRDEPSTPQGTLVAKKTTLAQPRGTTTFGVASFNVLGAGHTDGSRPPRKGWLNSSVRLDMARTLLKNQSVDLVGLQEMHPPQVRRWQTYTEWESFPNRVLRNNGSDNVVAWRKDVFTPLARKTIKIPYFNGRDVEMPYVRLQHRASGERVWALSVHPPANIGGDHQKWRNLAVQRMAGLVNRLKAEYPGEPIYTTGDMNDRSLFFCPFVSATGSAAANGGTASANSCTPPVPTEIDWIMGTAPNTFSSYMAFRTPYVRKTSDHPFVVARANIPSAAMESAGAKRVVTVNVEGLRGATARRLSERGRAPGVAAMARIGASTFNARIAPESARGLPNLMSMVTGRRVQSSLGGHGVATNKLNGTVHEQQGGYVSTMFDLAHNNGRSTAVHSSSTLTDPLRDSWSSTTGGPDPYGPDNGRAKLSSYQVSPSDAHTVSSFIRAPRRSLTLLHLTGPRIAGEKYGFQSRQYDASVQALDVQLRRVRRAIAGQDTVLVLTSTSGGVGHSVAPHTVRSSFRVPLMVVGPGVARGADLYQLNPGWHRPGKRRLPWAARPMTSAVVANLSLAFLKLPPIPGSTANTNQSFNVLRANS